MGLAENLDLVEGGRKWNKVERSGGLKGRNWLELEYWSRIGNSAAEIENFFRIEIVWICLYPHQIIEQLNASSKKKIEVRCLKLDFEVT